MKVDSQDDRFPLHQDMPLEAMEVFCTAAAMEVFCTAAAVDVGGHGTVAGGEVETNLPYHPMTQPTQPPTRAPMLLTEPAFLYSNLLWDG